MSQYLEQDNPPVIALYRKRRLVRVVLLLCLNSEVIKLSQFECTRADSRPSVFRRQNDGVLPQHVAVQFSRGIMTLKIYTGSHTYSILGFFVCVCVCFLMNTQNKSTNLDVQSQSVPNVSSGSGQPLGQDAFSTFQIERAYAFVCVGIV